MMRISNETIDCIKSYYVDEKNCFICPGKKQCISTEDASGKKIMVQERILSHTVHDLFLNFFKSLSRKIRNFAEIFFFCRIAPVTMPYSR